jgi:hypothetical protein
LGIGPNPQSPIPNPQSPIPIKENLSFLKISVKLNEIKFKTIKVLK